MKLFVLILSSVVMLGSAYAVTTKEWDGNYAPAKVSYMLYSGDLGEKGPPTARDTKVTLMVEGQFAREMFNSLGPDKNDLCATTKTFRVRERGDVSCSYDLERKTLPYTCYIGLNLKNGKSMQGVIC